MVVPLQHSVNCCAEVFILINYLYLVIVDDSIRLGCQVFPKMHMSLVFVVFRHKYDQFRLSLNSEINFLTHFIRNTILVVVTLFIRNTILVVVCTSLHSDVLESHWLVNTE